MILYRGGKENERTKNVDVFFDVAFFLFLCANLAHQRTSNTFDSKFRDYSFIILSIAIVLQFVDDPKNTLFISALDGDGVDKINEMIDKIEKIDRSTEDEEDLDYY